VSKNLLSIDHVYEIKVSSNESQYQSILIKPKPR